MVSEICCNLKGVGKLWHGRVFKEKYHLSLIKDPTWIKVFRQQVFEHRQWWGSIVDVKLVPYKELTHEIFIIYTNILFAERVLQECVYSVTVALFY